MPALALYGFVACARSQVFLSPPHVPGPYLAAAKAWVLRAYPRSYSEFGRRLICVAETLSLRARTPVRVLFRSPDF
jgi:hypothetical protein